MYQQPQVIPCTKTFHGSIFIYIHYVSISGILHDYLWISGVCAQLDGSLNISTIVRRCTRVEGCLPSGVLRLESIRDGVDSKQCKKSYLVNVVIWNKIVLLYSFYYLMFCTYIYVYLFEFVLIVIVQFQYIKQHLFVFLHSFYKAYLFLYPNKVLSI